MPVPVLMPVITAEGDDAVVTSWLVDDGATVVQGQLLAEVQAEKVAEDVLAPASGIVGQRVAINEPVPQGSPICSLLPAVEEAPPPEPEPPAPVGRAAETRSPVSPAARRLAQELGVDVSTVAGTGPGGRITEADVRAVAGPAGASLTGLRAVIARNMRLSHSSTAHVTITTTADLTGRVPEHVTATAVKAVAQALADHPDLNGTRDGDRFQPAETAHVSLAMQTSEGLVAPVIRRPAGKPVSELADEIARMAEDARGRRLTAADFEGGTFSVTNLGGYGVDVFTPLINPPQVAILGVGAIRARPGFDRAGQVVRRDEMALSLTFDHAFVDGAPAAAFLSRVREILEGGEPGGDRPGT